MIATIQVALGLAVWLCAMIAVFGWFIILPSIGLLWTVGLLA